MIPKYRVAYKNKILGEVGSIDFIDQTVTVPVYDSETGEYLADLELGLNQVILMQSTGLFDKNGKEIFEGDVIKFNDVWAEYCYEGYVDGCSEGENIVEIVKTKNGWGFGKTKFTDSSIFYFLEEERMTFREIVESNDFNMVVVGNIYENPELVEVLDEK
ncbi:YopX family protein [Streptococcus suis]|uniref:YopX family protein n=2 Tax=Streptococcus suis TaxID=1307 RepID=UPI00237D2E38|nr:YopX family protein [Streptococcus suis]MDE1692864.1 YopX family protein [Streptococcus suis]